MGSIIFSMIFQEHVIKNHVQNRRSNPEMNQLCLEAISHLQVFLSYCPDTLRLDQYVLPNAYYFLGLYRYHGSRYGDFHTFLCIRRNVPHDH